MVRDHLVGTTGRQGHPFLAHDVCGRLGACEGHALVKVREDAPVHDVDVGKEGGKVCVDASPRTRSETVAPSEANETIPTNVAGVALHPSAWA